MGTFNLCLNQTIQPYKAEPEALQIIWKAFWQVCGIWTTVSAYIKVQGLFIRHIINYTGYNQKWNVNQIRSTQWTVQKNKKNIYI